MLVNLYQMDIAIHTRLPVDLVLKVTIPNLDQYDNRRMDLDGGEIGIYLHLDDVAVAAAMQAVSCLVAAELRAHFEEV